VIVNGVTALVHDGTFVANHVPLQERENSITVKAVDVNGEHSEKTLSVTVESSARYAELHTDMESGLAPMETTLRLDGNFAFPAQPVISNVGPSEVEFLTGTEPGTWNVSLPEPGIYVFTAEAQDENGTSYSDTVAV